MACILKTIGLLQLRLLAIFGHWTTNSHCIFLSEWRVFLKPQSCSNWGCPLFEVIGLPFVTIFIFQRIPTEAARRLRALDYQLSLWFSVRVAGILKTIGLLQLWLPAFWGYWTTNCHCNSLSGISNWGYPPFEGIGLPTVTVILCQSGGYFWDHWVAPTEAARRLKALDNQL